jgi:hypothetical protein
MSKSPSPPPNPSQAPASSSHPQQPPQPATEEPASHLAEAIDDFLSDLDKRFSSISHEILTRLDDMAERCDRLEGEILLQSNSSGKGNIGKGLGIEEEGDER